MKPFLIRLAQKTGWVWPLRLHSRSVLPHPGLNSKKKDKGYQVWFLASKKEVIQTARIFGMPEAKIPWGEINFEKNKKWDTLEDGNPILFFGAERKRLKNGKRIIVRTIEFHSYIWYVDSYNAKILAKI